MLLTVWDGPLLGTAWPVDAGRYSYYEAVKRRFRACVHPGHLLQEGVRDAQSETRILAPVPHCCETCVCIASAPAYDL